MKGEGPRNEAEEEGMEEREVRSTESRSHTDGLEMRQRERRDQREGIT